jgi:hypothetical protein
MITTSDTVDTPSSSDRARADARARGMTPAALEQMHAWGLNGPHVPASPDRVAARLRHVLGVLQAPRTAAIGVELLASLALALEARAAVDGAGAP